VKVFFDTSAFLKVLKREEGYLRVVECLNKVRSGEYQGYTDTIAIGEMVYAFLSRGLDEEAAKARSYIEGLPNMKVVSNIPASISHRAAELKKRYYKRSEKTFFSLHDALHLAVAEKHCELLLTSDSDFKDVTEIKIELV
jgi:predicted nucleic acid-binding protein